MLRSCICCVLSKVVSTCYTRRRMSSDTRSDSDTQATRTPSCGRYTSNPFSYHSSMSTPSPTSTVNLVAGFYASAPQRVTVAVSVEVPAFVVIGRSCLEGCWFDLHCRPGSFLRFNYRPVMYGTVGSLTSNEILGPSIWAQVQLEPLDLIV